MRNVIRSQAEKYGTIGECVLSDDGTVSKLTRAFYRQGSVFKSFENYLNHPDKPCYVPEFTDNVYTANDFLEYCDGQQDLADELFEGVDWQCLESQAEDWVCNEEWVVCPNCNRFINYAGGTGENTCSKCGWKYED